MNSILSISHAPAYMQAADSQSVSCLSPAGPGDRIGSEASAPETAPAAPAPRMDEYIPGKEPDAPGLYQIVSDEDGLRSIAFDELNRPDDNSAAEGKYSDPLGRKGEDAPEEETCTTDTDKVDAEIRRLREKLADLQRQLSAAQSQPQQQIRLEKQIAQIQQELQAKDTDSYRRQHAECQMG